MHFAENTSEHIDGGSSGTCLNELCNDRQVNKVFFRHHPHYAMDYFMFLGLQFY